MRSQIAVFVAAFFAALALGQVRATPGPVPSPVKLLYFAHTEEPRSIQEIMQVVRATLELPQATFDESQGALAVRGTKDQIAAAQWLFTELDSTPIVPRQHSSNRGYELAGDKEGTIRIFYAAYTASMQEFQELAQLIRTTPEMRRTFTYNALSAIVVRGTSTQIGLAESLFNELDKPPAVPFQHSTSPEYLLSGDKEGVTRIFYVAYANGVPAFQEIAQAIRGVVEVRRTFTNNPQRAITVRGTAPQVAMAEWLFNDLDQPNLGSPVATLNADAIHEFRSPGSDDVVRVFYLINAPDVPYFQRVAQEVRVKAGIMRLFTYNDRRALVVRGNSAQIAAAERIAKPN
jgi:hypothetical protein